MAGKEELPVYGHATPTCLRPGGPPSSQVDPRREDGVVALALAMRTLADPSFESKGTLYGIEGIALGFLEGRRPWLEVARTSGAGGEDKAGTSGSGEADETGTWKSIDDDGPFPSLIDLFLRHGGSLKTVQELIRGIKAPTEEELEHWGPGRIHLRASTSPNEPNIIVDDRKEVEKWEDLKELHLWMKHVVGLMSNIINNGLGQAFFVSTPRSSLFFSFFIELARLPPRALSQDLKETSRLKSGFIHATRGG